MKKELKNTRSLNFEIPGLHIFSWEGVGQGRAGGISSLQQVTDDFFYIFRKSITRILEFLIETHLHPCSRTVSDMDISEEQNAHPQTKPI